MAHFAKIGLNNKVIEVQVVHNNVATSEQAGIDFLNTLFKTNDNWKQTSYNTSRGVHKLEGTPLRKNYAAIGYTYDVDRDAFIPPQYYPSWIVDEDTCDWEAPVPYPNDQKRYVWNESIINWEESTDSTQIYWDDEWRTLA